MTKDQVKIELPPGFHIQKTGGRPKQDEKFIAVTLARLWRVEKHSEIKKQADYWILEKWGKYGITDEAHIRSAVKRMSKGLLAPLRKSYIAMDPSFVLAISTVTNKGWFWNESLLEALPVCKGEISIEIEVEEPD